MRHPRDRESTVEAQRAQAPTWAVIASLTLTLACGRVGYETNDDAGLDAGPADAAVDAPSIDAERGDAADASRDFDVGGCAYEPGGIDTVLSTAGEDWSPTITPDGLLVCYARPVPPDDGDLFCARRTTMAAAFGMPIRLLRTNSRGRDFSPALAASGRRLYFASDRLPSAGGFDLWVADYDDATATFLDAVRLLELATPADDGGPFVTEDERVMVFHRGGGAEPRRLVITERPMVSVPFGMPMPVTGLGLLDPREDVEPALSPDLTKLVFCSRRPVAGSTPGSEHVFCAERRSGAVYDVVGPVLSMGLTRSCGPVFAPGGGLLLDGTGFPGSTGGSDIIVLPP